MAHVHCTWSSRRHGFFFFYRNYHIFSVVRLSYDVKNLADLRGCYPEGSYPEEIVSSVITIQNTE